MWFAMLLVGTSVLKYVHCVCFLFSFGTSMHTRTDVAVLFQFFFPVLHFVLVLCASHALIKAFEFVFHIHSPCEWDGPPCHGFLWLAMYAYFSWFLWHFAMLADAFSYIVQDYEPTGNTPTRSEPEIPSKGSIESLRAMPMEALLDEFRENHSYDSFEVKETRLPHLPRSPLTQINWIPWDCICMMYYCHLKK